MRFHIPGTKRGKKSKVLDTRDENLAAKMALELYHEFKSGRVIENKIDSLLDYTVKFIQFKQKPTKNRLPISKDTIDDYSLHLEHLLKALINAKINPKILSVENITDSIAQVVFDYLKREFDSPTTHRKYFKTYNTFYNYLIKEEKLRIGASPFHGWAFDESEGSNEVIYEKEFSALLKAIETKDKNVLDGNGKSRLMYFPWLGKAYKLSLFTGARRQEVPYFKWSNIIPNRKTGKLPGGIIVSMDFKNTNIQKLKRTKIKPIEINYDLADLLIEIGYNENKGKDLYLIDPEEKYSRDFIKNTLSRSFGYYIKFATDRELSFGCLRKTWFTNCSSEVGDQSASYMGGHSDDKVTIKHYINQLEKTGATLKFKRVFPPSKPPSKRRGKMLSS